MNYYKTKRKRKYRITTKRKQKQNLAWKRQIYAREQISPYGVTITRNDFPQQEQYIQYMISECDLKPSTAKIKISTLNQFIRFTQNQYNMETFDPAQITPIQIRTYLVYLKNERQNGPATRNNKLTDLTHYYNFLEFTDYLDEEQNPMHHIRRARLPRRLPIYLTQEEAKKILAVASTTPHADRSLAILRVFLQTGLRVSELTNLTIQDFDLTERTLLINGKGDKQRLVPLTSNTTLALQTYLKGRPHTDVAQQPLFLNDRGQPYNTPSLNQWFKQICAAAGVEKPGLTIRNLRHTCLTLLLQEGADLNSLRELAGHAKLSTTRIYIHVTQNQLRQAIKKHPLG